MSEFDFDLRDTNKYFCSSTQLDSSADEEIKTTESTDGTGEASPWMRSHQDGPVTGFYKQKQWIISISTGMHACLCRFQPFLEVNLVRKVVRS